MRVENGVRTAKLLKDGPEDPRIQSRLPGGCSNPDPGGLEPAGQLGSGTGDYDLLGSAPAERTC
jgi:hypothetical protein